MYYALVQKIKTTLNSISAIKEVHTFLEGSPQQYPAILFVNSGYENSFETNSENIKVYLFELMLYINTAGTTYGDIGENILPKTIDKITEAFDEAWDQGTSVDGHRIWWVLDFADRPRLSQEERGATITQPLTLRVKLLKDI